MDNMPPMRKFNRRAICTHNPAYGADQRAVLTDHILVVMPCDIFHHDKLHPLLLAHGRYLDDLGWSIDWAAIASR